MKPSTSPMVYARRMMSLFLRCTRVCSTTSYRTEGGAKMTGYGASSPLQTSASFKHHFRQRGCSTHMQQIHASVPRVWPHFGCFWWLLVLSKHQSNCMRTHRLLVNSCWQDSITTDSKPMTSHVHYYHTGLTNVYLACCLWLLLILDANDKTIIIIIIMTVTAVFCNIASSFSSSSSQSSDSREGSS